jgi:hypothetical protein
LQALSPHLIENGLDEGVAALGLLGLGVLSENLAEHHLVGLSGLARGLDHKAALLEEDLQHRWRLKPVSARGRVRCMPELCGCCTVGMHVALHSQRNTGGALV